MATGFFGGLSEGIQAGIQRNQTGDYQQKLLQIEEQRLKNQQQRQLHTEATENNNALLTAASEYIKQAKLANPNISPKDLQQHVQGMVDMLEQSTSALGLPRGYYQSQVTAAIAAPSEAARAEIEKTRAQATEATERGGYYRRGGLPEQSPDEATATFNDKNLTPRQRTGLDPLPTGYKTAQATQSDAPATQPLIPTPMSDRQKQYVEAAGMTAATADFEAVKYAFGGDLPAARSKVGGYASNIIRSRGDQYWIDRGVDPQTANAIRVEFKAMQHGALKVADIDARMTTAVAKAQQTAQILTGASGQQLIDNVDRTKFKDLNDLLISARKRTGDQNEIRLGIALETLASNYGVALGMGNSTLTDFQTQRAQSLLQQGWDKGQLGAAVDQLQKEMVREERGTRQALKTYIGGMQDTMRNEDTSGSSGNKSREDDPLGLLK